MFVAPPIATISIPSPDRSRPRRRASVTSAARSLAPSTSTAARRSRSANGVTVLSFAATGLAALAAALSSPLALIAALGAALVAGTIYWARFNESGRAAVQAVMGFFAPLLTTVRTTVGAIGDALMAGDIVLAGKIAVKGLQLVFQQGLAQLASLIGGTSRVGSSAM